jgi:hypothetical protein
MMLDPAQQTSLIEATARVLPVTADLRNFVDGVRLDAWSAAVPIDSTHRNAVTAIVKTACGQGWDRELVTALATRFPAQPTFAALLHAIDGTATVQDPFEEVLLAANRPFVNRRDLRACARDLASPTGARVLRIEGPPSSGTSFSYYLLQHVAARQGFHVKPFVVAQRSRVDELADEILRNLGVTSPALPAQGLESTEKWADKLALAVKQTIETNRQPLFMLFHDFPPAPPPETLSFISRLATFSDQDLRDLLRVVLVRFPGTLASDVDDVALREDAVPFTHADMVAFVMQISKARGWQLTEASVNAKIVEFTGQGPKSLREHFRFLRGLVLALAKAKAAGVSA